jgi:alkane 1-monooxygenase
MEFKIIPAAQVASPARALPFWLSLGLVPVVILAALQGGWTIALVPLATWGLFSMLDAVEGVDGSNADPASPDASLGWYRAITLVWFPVQFALLCWLLWYVPQADHLGWPERIWMFFGMGVVSGTVGINYSHELMHQKTRLERWLADLLLASVLYSHFRSEHLRVHHTWVGTPRDAVTARFNESFYRFFPRVLWQTLASGWRAEQQMLARRDLPVWHRSNPFWRYAVLQALFVVLAVVLGGWAGLALFAWQAFIAVWQLELVDYIEHYGLTRRHLGQGKYEKVLPRHSWNADYRASNWLLLNLQRHSDHHYKPDRRFPLLQTYDAEAAPQLPLGYAAMTAVAMVPPLWRRIMNRRVAEWRARHYPDILDWAPYNSASNPVPGH